MSDIMEQLIGKSVVIDTDSGASYIGELKAFDGEYLDLVQATVYDERQVKVSQEEYLIECSKNGIPVSRGRIIIRLSRVLSISPLDEIVIV